MKCKNSIGEFDHLLNALQVGDGEKIQVVQEDEENENNFYVFKDSVRLNKKFKLNNRDISLKIRDPPSDAKIAEYLETTISQIFDYIKQNIDDKDKVGIVFNSPTFIHGPAVLSYRLLSNISVNDIWELIDKVTQSRTKFYIDHDFDIKICTIEMPTGTGRNKKATLNKLNMKSIIQVKSKDNLCLPRAIVIARARVLYLNEKSKDTYNDYKSITSPKGFCQTKLAEELSKKANVIITKNGCGIEEMKKFQKYLLLEKFILKIYEISSSSRLHIIFDGANMIPIDTDLINYQKLYILYNDNHFDVITNLLSCVARKKYCEQCNKGFSHNSQHVCKNKCKLCYRAPACNLENNKMHCVDCHRIFLGEDCLRTHKADGSYNGCRSICETLKICKECNYFINCGMQTHICGQFYCKVCKAYKYYNHKCYIKPVPKSTYIEADEKKINIFIFYDFETTQNTEIADHTFLHKVNFCVAQKVCCMCMKTKFDLNVCKYCKGNVGKIFDDGEKTLNNFMDYVLDSEQLKKY